MENGPKNGWNLGPGLTDIPCCALWRCRPAEAEPLNSTCWAGAHKRELATRGEMHPRSTGLISNHPPLARILHVHTRASVHERTPRAPVPLPRESGPRTCRSAVFWRHAFSARSLPARAALPVSRAKARAAPRLSGADLDPNCESERSPVPLGWGRQRQGPKGPALLSVGF